ncbi:MAG TPA: SDR family oxidoreductase [Acidobacteriota bacterium]|nr:SDR family oxidoreductase [Acidobacteriota bacterium]
MILPEKTFQKQTVLITGGGTGLGKETALKFAGLGASLVIAGRRDEKLQEAAAEIRKAGAEVETFALDIRDSEKVQQMVDRAIQRFGQIDVLINNAAGNFPVRAENLSVNGWNAVVNIVLNGTFYCTHAAGLHMIKRRKGSIISIVHPQALTSGPGNVHSVSAKAGVIAMSRTLAVEWARYNIRVNTVAPGPFRSEGTDRNLWPSDEIRAKLTAEVPLGRFGTASEVADSICYLASDYASWVTGHMLVIDGGWSLNSEGFLDLIPEETQRRKDTK